MPCSYERGIFLWPQAVKGYLMYVLVELFDVCVC